jgi:hypothetical protein
LLGFGTAYVEVGCPASSFRRLPSFPQANWTGSLPRANLWFPARQGSPFHETTERFFEAFRWQL